MVVVLCGVFALVAGLMITYFACRHGHLTRLRYRSCPLCDEPMTAVADLPPAGLVFVAGWTLTRHDWAVCKALWIDPEQERPVFVGVRDVTP